LETLLDIDARWSQRLRIADKPGPLRQAAIFLAHSGDSWFWGLGCLAIWIFGDAAWKYRAVAIVFGIAITAVAVQSLKYVVKRPRPPGEWGQMYRTVDPHSFPSGHAARVAMLAVLATFLGPAWLTLALWIWAPLVALARVAMGVHYVSDITVGAAIGLIFGWLAAALAAIVFTIWPLSLLIQ
jgi:undecaprenyl-diphosphatase